MDPTFKNASVVALIIAANIPLPLPLPLEGDKACMSSWTSILGFHEKIKEAKSALFTMLTNALASVVGTLETRQTDTSNVACDGSSAPAAKQTSIGPEREASACGDMG